MTTPPECHLFIIFARETHHAVIFRRGPFLWTQLILWDTDADTFTEGHWFKGKIYTERCDLSPDASKLIYFSAKHYKGHKPQAVIENNWTAISRPPYFTALVMWTSSDTYGGGGYFEDDTTVYVSVSELRLQAQSHLIPAEFEVKPVFTKYDVGVGSNIYYSLLLEKRGWARIQGDFSWDMELRRYQNPLVIWRKDNIDHSYSLLWKMPLADRDTKPEFKLWRHQDNAEFVIDSHEWADFDQRGRLVYVNAGKLLIGVPESDRLESIRLADFSANTPKLIPPPAWARTWDQSSG